MTKYEEYYTKNEKQIVEDYLTFLKFKSISSEMEYKDEVHACANWLKAYLEKIGMATELWESSGHPVIFASHMAGPDKPTLLIYNHYDVQPVDPLDEWDTPPFEPRIEGNTVFARGAQDNKGQCAYVLQALKALFSDNQKPPLNIKVCIEGEEEMSSRSLSELLKHKKKELQADYLAIVDLGIPKKDEPAITLGVRGIGAIDVELTGSNTDLHSGAHGGIVYNPIHALVEMLSKLRDSETGAIAVPGFYDDVQALTDQEKKMLSLDFDFEEYEELFAAHPHGGEKHFTPLERAWTRPTIEINGIAGGYAGDGVKTVIPAKAKAKLSCRLVPNQDPHKIAMLIEAYIKEISPKGMRVKTHIHEGFGKALRANPDSKGAKSFAKAYESVFQKPCTFILEGGSIPIVSELAEVAGAEVILMGLGLPGDKIHAPNEHFDLERLKKGFLIMTQGIENLK